MLDILRQNEVRKLTEQDQKPRSRYGATLYDSNPSIPAANQISKTRRVQMGNNQRGLVIDNGSGEILGQGGAMFYEYEEVDKEKFVKIFLAGIRGAAGMSKAGLAVFQLIYDQMRDHKERDYVALDAFTSGLPTRTFQRGVRELIEREFLFRSPNPGLFWVNIKFMFNGNRLAFVKGYQLKGAGQQLDLLDRVETSTQEGEGASQ